MKKLKNMFPAFIIMLFIFITCFSTGCDNYKSEEFEISALDSKACQQLQMPDSLGVDTVKVVTLISFDSTIAVDTMVNVIDTVWVDTTYTLDTVLVDTTLYFTWTHKWIYDTLNATYRYVPRILDSLIAREAVLTNTAITKYKLLTPEDVDTVYFALQSTSGSLTFFFDQSVSLNLINQAGEITVISNKTMPLETAAGCTKLDNNDVEVPFIQTRLEINVPSNPSLMQLIKNEQTEKQNILVAIL